jgi:pimeloyl-ACP methyl ester carboxylesterase
VGNYARQQHNPTAAWVPAIWGESTDSPVAVVAANDEAIPPDAERQFAARMGATTVEAPSGHCAMVSHSEEVVELIETAAEAVAVPPEALAV